MGNCQEAMTTQKSLKRKYDSTRRQALAEATKIKIAEAARNLFFKRGYVGTTIEEVANEAGVSKETVYAVFGNKPGILALWRDPLPRSTRLCDYAYGGKYRA